MKVRLFAGILGCFLLFAGTARAEHKLLITEVLDAWQMEGEARFEYRHAKYTVERDGVEDGDLTTNAQETRFLFNLGLGHGLEVGASVPYLIYEKWRFRSFGVNVRGEEERDGFGDLAFSAKYSLFDEEEHHPFTLAAGFDLDLDTASENDGGTGAIEFGPFVAASRTVTERLIGYGIYRALLIEGSSAEGHFLTLGLETEINEMLTLATALKAAHITSFDDIPSREIYGLELTAYVQVAPNLYLLPAVAVEQSTDLEIEEDGTEITLDHDPTFFAGLSVYYLF